MRGGVYSTELALFLSRKLRFMVPGATIRLSFYFSLPLDTMAQGVSLTLQMP